MGDTTHARLVAASVALRTAMDGDSNDAEHEAALDLLSLVEDLTGYDTLTGEAP